MRPLIFSRFFFSLGMWGLNDVRLQLICLSWHLGVNIEIEACIWSSFTTIHSFHVSGAFPRPDTIAGEMEENINGAIQARAYTCAQLLGQFLSDEGRLEDSPKDGESMANGAVWAEDQIIGFNLWIASLGVFALGHASVEYRLKDHKEIYNLVLRLLEVLEIKLRYGKI